MSVVLRRMVIPPPMPVSVSATLMRGTATALPEDLLAHHLEAKRVRVITLAFSVNRLTGHG
jgi:hypothetical protein